jgi:membrane fusion protein (multidrug efflux system)
VLLVLGTLVGLVPRWRHRTSLALETRELSVQTVSVVSPAPSVAVPNLSLPAEVKPLFEAPIYARANGYLKRWLVDIGATVKEGDLLAEIDTPELDQELAQARAQLAQADAALALAKTTADRWAELLKTASVSEQEAAEKKADLELKQANVEAARANVSRLEELQRFQKVKAPFDGTITVRNTDVGQLISAGSTHELFRLAHPGQMAELTIPEIPGKVFAAKVVRTSGAMSADSRTLLVELAVDNSRGEILSGTYAQVRFTEAQPPASLTVPANCLLFRSEGPQVGVVGPDGKVELRNVALGRDFGPTVEIVKGLTTSDRVILNPSDSLVGGTAVRVAAESTQNAVRN